MKYIIIATKGDITKTAVFKEQDQSSFLDAISQLKLLGYSIKVYYGHEAKEFAN